jgi:C1A family cysteine protease
MAALKEQIIGGHAIVMVGFDDKHKRIKFVSFWGSSWGDHGFCYLSYDYVEKHLSDAWTFTAATE